MGRFIDKLKHAFAVGPEDPAALPALPESLESLARRVVDHGLETPAIIALESAVPLSFLGSQVGHMIWPVARMVTDRVDVAEVAEALEDRRTLRLLVDRIQQLAGEAGATS